MQELRKIAVSVLDGSRVAPGAAIPGNRVNSTGVAVRLPGATLEYYPAFWTRDAAMMLGSGFVPADEVAGWVRLIAGVQPGSDGIRLPHGLFVPGGSIPDHITLDGKACWYPGAMEDQGNGTFGFLPPADDAFYFIQMVREHLRLTGSPSLAAAKVATPYGEAPVADAAVRAFESVAADPATGLVTCDGEAGKTRVDWGFCDTVRKTGSCLMPSLLRRQAALDLRDLYKAMGQASRSRKYGAEAARISRSIVATFYKPLDGAGCLLSATGIGKQEDVWAGAYAVWQGAVSRDKALAIARRLRQLYLAGGTVVEGQVRHLPAGEFWQEGLAGHGQYQNGGYWGTPTGWFIAALRYLERAEPRGERVADRMFGEFMAQLSARKAAGAPFEWVNPSGGSFVNPRYASTVGLVYTALATARR